ncbi:hypothetical protein K1719_046571 [Acacia pycnantha]|nr:hypothetical protein K1719_046571 [Acacia pycnantha]
MDAGSSMDESVTTDSVSVSLSPVTIPSNKSSSPPLNNLCRVGSGASTIVDSDIVGVEAESRKLPSSKYKEDEAARAYDIAAHRFRGRDAVTNFKPLAVAGVSSGADDDRDDYEAVFLNAHSKAEIVDMLRKHTYNDELEQFKRNYGLTVDANGKRIIKEGSKGSGRVDDAARDQLFESSDTERRWKIESVGDPEAARGEALSLAVAGGSVLAVHSSDGGRREGRIAEFRRRRREGLEVQEKNLKAGDTVFFSRSTGPDKQLYIDWKNARISTTTTTTCTTTTNSGVAALFEPAGPVVRLFGVNILKMPGSDAISAASGCYNGKRREMDLFSLECTKKPKIIGAL